MLYAASTILTNEIWFVLGMQFAFAEVPKRIHKQNMYVGFGVLFISLSVMITVAGVNFEEMNFLMGLLACTAVVGGAVAKDKNYKQSVVVSWLSQ